ncbi:MAG TPA: EpsI family protein [Phycisphaerae bacterium]
MVATALLAMGGMAYRVTAGRLEHRAIGTPVQPGTLERLPLTLGEWTGRDTPLDDRIIQATDTDDHVNRTYRRLRTREAVALFVAYGVRPRDLMPHRPEVCYPGAGWTHDETRVETLTSAGGTPLPCQVHRFHRGGLEYKRIAVLNYYLVDGRVCADVSALRRRTWQRPVRAGYIAQVQIACADASPPEMGERTVRCFAIDSVDAIRALLQEAVDDNSH